MDAVQLPDGMPPRKKAKTTEVPSTAEMDDLQDDVLPIIVSFLPAHEAVRTCVLSKRWRHVWTSAPGLRITAVKGFRSADKFNHFVDRLLSLRRHSHPPLESCDFLLNKDEFSFDWSPSVQHVYLEGLQSALDCNVKILGCRFMPINVAHDLPEPADPLFSQHIERLELHCIPAALDFSACPALLDLKMEHCITPDEDNMTAPSLEHLSMTSCFFPDEHRTSISLPSLVRLEMIKCYGRFPLLESLPSLETGIVKLDEDSEDWFCRSVGRCASVHSCYSSCAHCHFAPDFAAARGRSYFFQGLSRATHLKLSATYEKAAIFQKDLSWSPTFPMLKTLVLDDWCLDDDLSAVILFIQQSPNLEKLTLELVEDFDSSMVREESYSPLEGAFASDHLKMVEIKCEMFDWRINRILKILSTSGVSLEKIYIRQTDTSSGSECFHFVCTGFSLN